MYPYVIVLAARAEVPLRERVRVGRGPRRQSVCGHGVGGAGCCAVSSPRGSGRGLVLCLGGWAVVGDGEEKREGKEGRSAGGGWDTQEGLDALGPRVPGESEAWGRATVAGRGRGGNRGRQPPRDGSRRRKAAAKLWHRDGDGKGSHARQSDWQPGLAKRGFSRGRNEMLAPRESEALQ